LLKRLLAAKFAISGKQFTISPWFKGEEKMKLLIDKQNRPWIYSFVAMGLIFLLIGLGVGVGVSHGGFSRIEALYPFSNAAAQEPKPMTAAQGLPDFVALAKRLKPEVVNISATQTAKEVDVPNPFDQNDPSGKSWKKFFGAPVPRGAT
jgi:hypothetical protein